MPVPGAVGANALLTETIETIVSSTMEDGGGPPASDLQIPSLVRERLELQRKELRFREKRCKSCSSFGIQRYSSPDSNILLQDNRLENFPCLVVHVDSRLGIIGVSRRAVLRDQKQLVNGVELDVITGLNFAFSTRVRTAVRDVWYLYKALSAAYPGIY